MLQYAGVLCGCCTDSIRICLNQMHVAICREFSYQSPISIIVSLIAVTLVELDVATIKQLYQLTGTFNSSLTNHILYCGPFLDLEVGLWGSHN